MQDLKNRQKFTIWALSEIRRAISSQLRHVSTIGKIFKQHYLLHMSSQYGELRPTSGWDRFVSLGHPSKFQRVSSFGFVTAATSLNGSQSNFAWCLAVSWAVALYIHFRGFLPRNGILPGATFTLRPSLALSYLAALLHCTLVVGVSQTLGVEQRAPPIFGSAAITLDIGPHSSFSITCAKCVPITLV